MAGAMRAVAGNSGDVEAGMEPSHESRAIQSVANLGTSPRVDSVFNCPRVCSHQHWPGGLVPAALHACVLCGAFLACVLHDLRLEGSAAQVARAAGVVSACFARA